MDDHLFLHIYIHLQGMVNLHKNDDDDYETVKERNETKVQVREMEMKCGGLVLVPEVHFFVFLIVHPAAAAASFFLRAIGRPSFSPGKCTHKLRLAKLQPGKESFCCCGCLRCSSYVF